MLNNVSRQNNHNPWELAVCITHMYWQLRLRTKRALVERIDHLFGHVARSLSVAGDVCWCEYSRVGRRGSPCRNSLRRSSLIWAGWPSLCSRRTGLAFAVGRYKHLHFFILGFIGDFETFYKWIFVWFWSCDMLFLILLKLRLPISARTLMEKKSDLISTR